MRSALLIIDMQAGILAANPAPHQLDDVLNHINFLHKKAHEQGTPVFYIQHEATGFLDFQSEAWKLHPELETNSHDIFIRKTRSEPFTGTDLSERLENLKVSTLIICGYASEFCIDSSVRAASWRGFNIQLVSDAHTTTDKAHLSAEQIRQHHNLTLSAAPNIRACKHNEVEFSDIL